MVSFQSSRDSVASAFRTLLAGHREDEALHSSGTVKVDSFIVLCIDLGKFVMRATMNFPKTSTIASRWFPPLQNSVPSLEDRH